MIPAAELLVGSGAQFNVGTKEHSEPGYLYSSIRSMLFAELLRKRDGGHDDLVGICDNAARDVTNSLIGESTVCEEKRPFAPQLLISSFSPFLPPGVIKGWETNKWFESGPDANFSCSTR